MLFIFATHVSHKTGSTKYVQIPTNHFDKNLLLVASKVIKRSST